MSLVNSLYGIFNVRNLLYCITATSLISLALKRFRPRINLFKFLIKSRSKLSLIRKSTIVIGLIILNILGILTESKTLFLAVFIINILFFILFYLNDISNITKMYRYISEIKDLKKQNYNLNNMYDEVRSFKHDFSNIIQALGGYIKCENVEGLKKMYDKLQRDIKSINNKEILNPKIINNPAIYSILNNKYTRARFHGIEMNLEILADLESIDTDIDILDFCRILGILIDNAIDAASKCDKKEILVRFIENYDTGKTLIIVENTYNNFDVDLNKIFEKTYTSKGEKVSHGLRTVESKKDFTEK